MEVTGESVRLARPPDTITLYAVARAVGEAAPRAVPTGSEPAAAILRALYMRADAEERGVLQGTSLEDVYRPHARRRSESEDASDLRLGPSEAAQSQAASGQAGHGSGVHPPAPRSGTLPPGTAATGTRRAAPLRTAPDGSD